MVTRSIICLIGPHGSGKSTIGKQYEANGYTHINVGFLARLARRKILPKDVPLRLMFELRKHVPGTILGEPIVLELIKWVGQLDKVVIDGFPSDPKHVDLMPDRVQWQIHYVFCPRHVREFRLASRSLTTNRRWTPGLPSERDLSLAPLLKHLRKSGIQTTIVKNNK